MPRRPDLDQAKGLAIILVVFGHIVARADPAGVFWYEPLRHAVYAFHMPFFLYLSGMAAALALAEVGAALPPAAWPDFALARARRLLVPFFGLGLCIVAAKFCAARVMFVDNAPTGILPALDGLFWHTAASPARSIWYAYVLFFVSVAALPCLWLCGGRVWLFLGVCAAAYCFSPPPFMYADELARYAVFFALGLAAGQADAGWLNFVDRHWRWLAAVFVGLLSWIVLKNNFISFPVTLLFTGVISMPVLHGLLRTLPEHNAQIFLYLGRYSFMIYLFNTIFIGFAKGLLLHVSSWDGMHFLPFAVALGCSGLFGPIILKHYAFRRMRLLDRLTN